MVVWFAEIAVPAKAQLQQFLNAINVFCLPYREIEQAAKYARRANSLSNPSMDLMAYGLVPAGVKRKYHHVGGHVGGAVGPPERKLRAKLAYRPTHSLPNRWQPARPGVQRVPLQPAPIQRAASRQTLPHAPIQPVPSQHAPNTQPVPSQHAPNTQPVPLQRVPLQSMRMQSTPSQRVPLKRVPVPSQHALNMQPVPSQRVPNQRVPLRNVPLQSVRMQNTPSQRVPLQRLPLKSVPLKTVRIQNAPMQSLPKQRTTPGAYTTDAKMGMSRPPNMYKVSTGILAGDVCDKHA